MVPNNLADPRTSRGLKDLFSSDLLYRNHIVSTIRSVYEGYGFVPLDTPAIEYMDVLSGTAGEEAQRSIFKVTNPEREALGLRFDLTVPLARVVAQYPDLPSPYRRYQVSKVWRADKPAPGRFREFTQFDIDSVGVDSDLADAEILAAMCDTLSKLEVGRYRVRFSSRRLLNLLLDFAGIPKKRGVDVFRVLDKLQRMGLEKVKLELTDGYVDESGAKISGLGLSDDQVSKIERFLAIRSSDRRQVISELRELFKSVSGADKEIATVERISESLESLGYGNNQVSLDISIARGLAYYTGPVFEAILLDAPEFGSVFGGGRYDDLVMRFLGQRIPAVGASIGVDRLLAALIELGKVPDRKSTSFVLVTNFGKDQERRGFELTFELRRAGVPAEFYFDSGDSLGAQLKYADQTGIPYAILYGPDEAERGVVTVKDLEVGRMQSRKIEDRKEWVEKRPGQFEVEREDFTEHFLNLMGKTKRV